MQLERKRVVHHLRRCWFWLAGSIKEKNANLVMYLQSRVSMRRNQSTKVAMSLLVRDEADIIHENICFHAAHGIDTFVVTDNGSIDGTRDQLTALSKRFNLHIIDEPRHTIDQDLWVTRMAEWLRENTDVEWVINNDADEFWVTDGMSLPEALRRDLAESDVEDIGVLSCERFNYLPSQGDVCAREYRFYHNKLKVIKDAQTTPGRPLDNVLITLQGHKVASRLSGLKTIAMGNHAAAHSGQMVHSKYISIAHYPLRTFDQFRTKVVNHGSSIARNDRFGQGINWHLRGWYDSYLLGQLEIEYNRYVIGSERECDLIESGVLQKDASLTELVRRFDRFSESPIAVA